MILLAWRKSPSITFSTYITSLIKKVLSYLVIPSQIKENISSTICWCFLNTQMSIWTIWSKYILIEGNKGCLKIKFKFTQILMNWSKKTWWNFIMLSISMERKKRSWKNWKIHHLLPVLFAIVILWYLLPLKVPRKSSRKKSILKQRSWKEPASMYWRKDSKIWSKFLNISWIVTSKKVK